MAENFDSLRDSDLLVDPGGEQGFIVLDPGLGNKKEAGEHKKK